MGNEGHARQGHEGSHEEGWSYEGHEAPPCHEAQEAFESRHEGQDHESHEGAYEGCSHEGHEEGHEEGYEVRMVATKSGLTYLITVHFNSCCSMRALIGFKGFEARIWSITFLFRSDVCPAR